MTIGIPRSLFYYHDGEVWISFLKSLNINYIISNETDSRIMSLGNKYATDEMCLSMKNYIGHVASLVGKCDTVLVPRIDNYGRNDQTCTNFLLAYDLIRNLFPINIITYNINLENKETEENAYIKASTVAKLGYIAVADEKGVDCQRFVFGRGGNERALVRELAASNAINMLRKKLL